MHPHPVALVTGGSRGIGRGICVELARRGYAVAVNYAEATHVLRQDGRVAGVGIRDTAGGERLDVRARTVLNAAGPWAASWLSGQVTAAHPPVGLSRAMNVVTRRIDVAQGCAGLARGRFLFLIPWRDVTLVGTSHDPHRGTGSGLRGVWS